jgi:hypothetical protein
MTAVTVAVTAEFARPAALAGTGALPVWPRGEGKLKMNETELTGANAYDVTASHLRFYHWS